MESELVDAARTFSECHYNTSVGRNKGVFGKRGKLSGWKSCGRCNGIATDFLRTTCRSFRKNLEVGPEGGQTHEHPPDTFMLNGDATICVVCQLKYIDTRCLMIQLCMKRFMMKARRDWTELSGIPLVPRAT
jgi:hypothetical protein